MPYRLATAATGSRSASRMIATICSSVNRPFRIAPSESGASLSTNRRSENPGAGHEAQRDTTRLQSRKNEPTRRRYTATIGVQGTKFDFSVAKDGTTNVALY